MFIYPFIHSLIQKYNERLYVLGTPVSWMSEVRYDPFPHELDV